MIVEKESVKELREIKKELQVVKERLAEIRKDERQNAYYSYLAMRYRLKKVRDVL